MTNDNDLDKKQEKIICSCTRTTESKIQQLIDNGADNMDEISSATGATTGCGACDVLIEELLRDNA